MGNSGGTNFIGIVTCASCTLIGLAISFGVYYGLKSQYTDLVEVTGTVLNSTQVDYRCCQLSSNGCGCNTNDLPRCENLLDGKDEGVCCLKDSCCIKRKNDGTCGILNLRSYKEKISSCRTCYNMVFNVTFEYNEKLYNYGITEDCKYESVCVDEFYEKYKIETPLQVWFNPNDPKEVKLNGFNEKLVWLFTIPVVFGLCFIVFLICYFIKR